MAWRAERESVVSTEGTESGSDVPKEVIPSIVVDLVDFLNKSWTPFHATEESKKMLLQAGFCQLSESEEWNVKPGGRYFFTRNMSSIVAFAIGQKYVPGNGFNVIAAHTDSPCLKLKPISSVTKHGFLLVGVQVYGGGLWHTWFDRDLSVAGRVLIRTKEGEIKHCLVKVERPIMRVPTLAIHLDRTISTDGFKPNLETHLAPILATHIKTELSVEGNGAAVLSNTGSHHSLLVQIVAEELGCDPEEVIDFELNVCDTQPSCVAGARREFLFSGRLDNLLSSYCALRALIDTTSDTDSLENETSIRLVALFDNEEVGSSSAQGAGSPSLFQTMKRVVTFLAKDGQYEGILERSMQRSFIVSADMAHAMHPSYPERHEEQHQPKLHRGLVVKQNANQRYATTLVSSFLFTEVAKRAGIPTQNFVVRNDMGCGSTIGPILAAALGIRTVDVGVPQLSMHSIREMCGTQDVDISYQHFRQFYAHFSEIDRSLVVDK